MSVARQKRILLVEDEAIISIAEKAALEDSGYSVRTVFTGEQAVRAASEEPDIDLILMDIDLGEGIDGTEAGRQILRTRNIPIVFLSSHTDAETVEKTAKITSYGYVVKDTSWTVIDASLKMAFTLFEARRELMESEERFQALFNDAPLGYQSLDIRGDFLEVNRKWLEMLGYERGEVIGEWFGSFLTPDCREGFRQRFPLFKAQGHIHSEFEMLHKNGSKLSVAFEGKISYQSDGTFKQTHCILQDISNQRKSEKQYRQKSEEFEALNEELQVSMEELKAMTEELQAQNEELLKTEATLRENEILLTRQNILFSTLLKNLPIGVFMVEAPSGKPLLANDAAMKLLGRGILPSTTKENISEVYKAYRQGTRELYPPEEMPILLGMNGKSSHIEDLMVERPDGTQSLLEIYGAPIIDEHGKIWASLVSFMDISERKAAEKKIQTLLGEKELILQEVHHRIKNNMNTVYGLLVLQAGTMKDHQAINALEEAAKRIQAMMLLYEKLFKSADFTEISVFAYIPRLIDEIIESFPNSRFVTIEKNIEDFMLTVSKIQPVSLLLNELLTNIMKYAFTGKTAGKITVSVQLREQRVSLTIADNGNGMPESVDFTNSTGFGLVLVSGLTQQLDGTIRIERENGTRITLEFDR